MCIMSQFEAKKTKRLNIVGKPLSLLYTLHVETVLGHMEGHINGFSTITLPVYVLTL